MKQLMFLASLFLSFLMNSNIFAASGSEANINLELRVHIITNLKMKKERLEMECWLTEKDFDKVVLPELNKIWAPANISFTKGPLTYSPALEADDKEQLISNIVNAKRNSSGKSDPLRMESLRKLIDWKQHDNKVINIYFVPYLGETFQGVASTSRRGKIVRRSAFVGVYTDKPSGAKKKPQKFTLMERKQRFKIGSISRTLAHEVGHLLGLSHPDPKTQKKYGLVMGGKKPGYEFTQEEMVLARKNAVKISK